MREVVIIPAQAAAVAHSVETERTVSEGETATIGAFGLTGDETVTIYAVKGGVVETMTNGVLTAGDSDRSIRGPVRFRLSKSASNPNAGAQVTFGR